MKPYRGQLVKDKQNLWQQTDADQQRDMFNLTASTAEMVAALGEQVANMTDQLNEMAEQIAGEGSRTVPCLHLYSIMK